MTSDNFETQAREVANEVRANWGWLMFMGVVLTILGFIGVYMAGTLTLVSILWFGFLVIAGGVLILIDAFRAEGWKAKVWEIIIALAYIVAGIIMVVNPGASAVWFTLIIAGFLLVTGIFRIVMGFQIRNEVKGWGWTVFGGLASIVLAFLIFNQWPVSGLWVIGMFIAIEMILHGTSMISIAMAAKSSKSETTSAA